MKKIYKYYSINFIFLLTFSKSIKAILATALILLIHNPYLAAQKSYDNNPAYVNMTRNGSTATITWEDNGSYYYYWCISPSMEYVPTTPGDWPEQTSIKEGKIRGTTTTITATGITSNVNLYAYVVGVNTGWEWTLYPTSSGAVAPLNHVPAITTNEVSSVTHNSVALGGNITNNGGATVSGRGVVYSSTDNTPTIAEGATQNPNGSGTGSFSETITGLSMNTTYYVAAYATNSEGTAYGMTKTFTTYGPPTVSTTATSNITAATAASGGSITDDGGYAVTSRGVCWNTTGNPTISNSHTTDGPGTGTFSSGLTGLTQGTKYYIMAYATNTVGTAYGNQISFTTNTRPVAVNDSYTRFYTDDGTVFNVPVNGVLANDTDQETANSSLTVGNPIPASNVSHGSLTLNSNGSFTYTSTDGFTGVDSYTYYVNDGSDNSGATTTVTLNIVTPRFTGEGTDDNFSNPDNWNTGYVPNEEKLDLVIASDQHIDFDIDYLCRDLKFESGASFKCTTGHKLTITRNVLDRNNNPKLKFNSPMVISTSLNINNN